MNSDYKKYSLENLKNWVQDVITTTDASTEEIFNTIKEAVQEEYYIHKHHTSKCYELLALLNGNGEGHLTCDKDDTSTECKIAWNDFWEENYYPEDYESSDVSSVMPPWGHSDMEALRYTEEELNAMCDKAASDEEKNQCREYNLREAEYYNKSAELDLNSGPKEKYVGWQTVSDSKFNEMFPSQEKMKQEVSRNDSTRLEYKEGLIYESPDGGKTVYSRKPGETERTLVKEEKVNKWVLSVGVDGLTGDCFVNLPDDLLELADLKEGDEVEWVEKKDGTYILRKVIKQIKMEEC